MRTTTHSSGVINADSPVKSDFPGCRSGAASAEDVAGTATAPAASAMNSRRRFDMVGLLHCVKEDIERRDLFIANDHHVPARLRGRLARRAGTPGHATGVMEGLGLAAQRVDGARARRAKGAGVPIEGVVPAEHALGHVEHAVVRLHL